MASRILIITNSYETCFSPKPVKTCNVDGDVLEREFKKNSNYVVQKNPNVSSAKDLRSILDDFVAECNNDPTDLHTAFFIFSGHGGHGKETPDGFKPTEDDFILTDDGKGKIVKKEIRKKFIEIKSKHKVLIFNCCRGKGKMGILQSRPHIEEEMKNEDLSNTWVLHATTPHHVAWAGPHGPHKTTVFIWLFLEALEDLKQNIGSTTFESIDRLINLGYANYQPPSNADWVSVMKQDELNELTDIIKKMGCHLEKFIIKDENVQLPFSGP